eukprot:1358423-Pyramimonas_sp.AAC.1
MMGPTILTQAQAKLTPGSSSNGKSCYWGKCSFTKERPFCMYALVDGAQGPKGPGLALVSSQEVRFPALGS